MNGTSDQPPASGAASSDRTVALLERILSRLDHLEARMDRMAMAKGVAPNPIADRLSQPGTAEAIGRILDRVELVADGLALAEGVPGLVAMGADLADEAARTAQRQGIDIDARARGLGGLLARLSDPAVTSALNTTLDMLPKVTPHIEAAPGLAAMAMDMLDDWVRGAIAKGINPETLLHNSLTAVSRLGALLDSEEFACLMNSGMLDPQALVVIGQAAQALSRSQITQPVTAKPIGLFGLLKTLKDPEIQKALHFTLGFARQFGAQVGQPLPQLEGPCAPCEAAKNAR